MATAFNDSLYKIPLWRYNKVRKHNITVNDVDVNVLDDKRNTKQRTHKP